MRIVILLMGLVLLNNTHAQIDTLVFTPNTEDGIDAWISDKYPNGNYGNYGEISMAMWVNGTISNKVRSLMDFRLWGLPPSATILSAKLTLHVFGFPFNWNGTPLYGTNDFYISRIVQPWYEDSVTWSNAPAFDNTFQVYVSPTTAPTASRTIDVTSLIIDRWINPNANFGMLLRMVNELTPSAVAAFASSDNVNPALLPSLTVIYDYSMGMVNKSKDIPDIRIWPNPCKDLLNINVTQGNIEEVTVYDLLGRTVLFDSPTNPGLQHTSNFSSLLDGQYFLRIRTSTGVHVSKIIVI